MIIAYLKALLSSNPQPTLNILLMLNSLIIDLYLMSSYQNFSMLPILQISKPKTLDYPQHLPQSNDDMSSEVITLLSQYEFRGNNFYLLYQHIFRDNNLVFLLKFYIEMMVIFRGDNFVLL